MSSRDGPTGYLALILHAHLPYTREPEHERFLEEAWLHEALTETYLPLLLVLERLERDGVEFRLTMSLTPTLVSMLDDELLRERYRQRLESLLELCEKESVRHRHHPAFRDTAVFYRERVREIRDFYLNALRQDVASAFRRLQDRGLVELIACPATHGFLPLLRHEPAAVRAQISLGVEAYRRSFGREPQGMWLPECGYYPGLDDVLAEAGIRYIVLESHGVLRGSTRARRGVHAPVVCPSGVAAFARDPDCSRQVWSREEGFPGHPDYREFYRDIGHLLPMDYLHRHAGPDGIRVETGVKYHRITGKTEAKEAYVRRRAMERAAEHADVFVRWRREQVSWLSGSMDRRPIVVAPYDAELLGHWWFEGPEWLDLVLRRLADDPSSVLAVTPSEYLAEYPVAQLSVPSSSSWGYRGFNEVWLNGTNDWIYPRLHDATRRLARLAFRNRGVVGSRRRVLNQACRELLLAQASDWAFILKSGTAVEYARARTEGHLGSFEKLLAAVEGAEGPASAESLALVEGLERKDRIFPDLQFEVFQERVPRPSFAAPESPAHVAFLAAEAAPLVKVGGLADVAGSLPAALARLGVRVTVILPAYATIDRARHGIRPLPIAGEVLMDSRRVPFRVLEATGPGASGEARAGGGAGPSGGTAAPGWGAAPGVRVLLVEEDDYFGRAGVYVDPETGAEYPDTAERFVFFTKAALETLRELRDPVDVVHCHDHQTALAPAYVKINHLMDPVLGLAASVFTLHNLGYQGIHEPEVLDVAGFGRDQLYPGSPFEHFGKVNFMKAGIAFADKINTVSEGYAREIVSDEKIGAGLRLVLAERGGDFSGILNGIDVAEWDPSRDPHIPRPYSRLDPSGKREAKRRLMDEVGLAEKAPADTSPSGAASDVPLVGMITRLVDQKGLDLVEETLEDLLSLGIRLVVLGSGLPKYEEFLRQAAEAHPGRVAVVIKFDEALAHRIEAGADMFLMPSLYEPCGLNQMYSLRYGTIPVVRETGGLADTVDDDDATPGGGVGFSFLPYDAAALVDAMGRAVRAYRDPERWGRIVRAAMARDFSWDASARRYLDLYRAALAARA